MKVTVCFGSVRVVVPCGDGELLVRDLIREAIRRYKKASGKCPDSWVVVHHLQSQSGILDPDDKLNDVADDREQILASFEDAPGPPGAGQGDGASGSSVGTGSPDIFRQGSGKYSPPHIEVTGEHTAGGLQVRRGSEPSLLQTEPRMPVALLQDPTKRWSAAPICRDDDGSDRLLGPGGYMGPRDRLGNDWAHPESDLENSIDRETSPNHFQRSGRLSMQFLGDGNGYRWAEAAERASANHAIGSKSLPRESKRREPLGQANSSTTPPPIRESEGVELTLILNEPGAPLGLRASPDSQHGGLIVQSVESDSRAARGKLKQGDRILEINGTDLLNLPLYKVQDVFKKNINAVELRLTVFRRTPEDNKENVGMIEVEERPIGTKIATVSPTRKVPGKTPSVLSSNTRKLGRKIEITLRKGGHGLGFSITTRDNPAGGHCPIYIKNILPRGAAVEDGRLRPGDRLLEVNGEQMTGRSQPEVVDVFRATPPGAVVKIIVSRQDSSESNEREIGCDIEEETSNSAQQSENHREIINEKPNVKIQHTFPDTQDTSSNDSFVFPWRHREVMTLDIPVHDTEKAGLGVSVKGKTGSPGGNNASGDLGIFIKSVIHGGAASRDGRLKTNDQLLNVNGVSLRNQSNADAMDTLRRAMLHTEGRVPGSITLTVARKVNRSGSPPSEHHSRKSNRSASLDLDELSESSELLDGSALNTVIYVPNVRKSIEQIENWRNPVVEKLTGHGGNYNGGLRNESYYMATNDTYIGSNRYTSPTVNIPSAEPVLIEEDGSDVTDKPIISRRQEVRSDRKPSLDALNISPTSPIISQNEPQTPSDVTYASQLSLDVGEAFSRDAVGRRSMSEKHHAALDAKETGTYQRNKKLKEQREREKEREKRERNGEMIAKAVLATAGSHESLASISKSPDNRPEDADRLCELGPSLGLKKSSSLESLQTMVQEIQMGDDRVHSGLRAIRGRACGDSLRAVVEAPTDSQARKHWLTEDGSDSAFTSRNGPLQSSLTDGKLKHGRKKHKPGLLKGIGSMFRFGKHRKDTVADITEKYEQKLDKYDHKNDIDSRIPKIDENRSHDNSRNEPVPDRPPMPPKYQNPPPVNNMPTDNNMNRFSHYVNYEEIQNHLSRRQQLYHSTRSNRSEAPQRPILSYYEYESVRWATNNPSNQQASYPTDRTDHYSVAGPKQQPNQNIYNTQQAPPYNNSSNQSQHPLSKKQPIYGNPKPSQNYNANSNSANPQQNGLPRSRGPYVTSVMIKEQHSGSKV